MTSDAGPEPLRSYFTTGELGAMCLYVGTAAIVFSDGGSFPVEAEISLMWTPSPHIAAAVTSSQMMPWANDALHLELPLLQQINHGFPIHARARMVHLSGHETGRVPMSSAVLVLDDIPCIGDWDHHPAAWISIHIVDSLDFAGSEVTTERRSGQEHTSINRSTIENSQWKATLDCVPNARRLLNEAMLTNSHAVTHMAKMESTAGHPLYPKIARQYAEELTGTLTIATGVRVGACLIQAYDKDDREVWATWFAPSAEPYAGHLGCLPRGYALDDGHIGPPDLSTLSQGFVDLNRGDDSQLLQRLVNWYIAAVSSEDATSIVFSAAGLELLTYWELVLGQGMSAEGFQRMHVPDQLRLFLSACKMPHSVPGTLTNLQKLVKSGGQQDGPWYVTDFRNGLVHPPTRKRDHVHDVELLFEVRTLALWYFEVALLRLLGYAGAYKPRVSPEPQAVVVPWANDASIPRSTLQ